MSKKDKNKTRMKLQGGSEQGGGGSWEHDHNTGEMGGWYEADSGSAERSLLREKQSNVKKKKLQIKMKQM